MKYIIISFIFLVIYTSYFIADGFNVPGTRVKKNALVPTDGNTWTDGIISYFIDNTANSLDAKRRRVVRAAMEFIESRTCVQFARKRTTNNRIFFVQDLAQEFCFANGVGKREGRNNVIVLTENCGYQVTNVVRLIMQSMGFVPNSARPDRDTYMTVNEDNFKETVKPEISELLAAETFFEDFKDPLPPFEFGSILSYGPSEFSSPVNPTFVATEAYADYQNTMGTGRITFQDIKMINDLYNCKSSCTQKLACLNGGYQNPNDCELCFCPDGYSGRNCTDLPIGNMTERTQGYNLLATSEWQKRFIEFGEELKIPVRNEYKNRVDWIKAPTGKSTEVRVISFYEHPNKEEMPNPGCTLYGVELKTESTTLAGVRICTKSLVNKTFTSKINPTPIISYNRWGWTSYWLEYRYGQKFLHGCAKQIIFSLIADSCEVLH